MCSIICVTGKNKESNARLFINRMKHRGPHGICFYDDSFISIGFNRLAINDNQHGMQPFYFQDYVGVFNGEIYNYKNLRQSFKNHTFTSQSDMEVILPLLVSKGMQYLLDNLDGVYSGVIYNKTTHEIFTIRDYIGKKSFFYAEKNQQKYLVSELQALSDIDVFDQVPLGIAKVMPKGMETHFSHTINDYHPTTDIKASDFKALIFDAVKKRLIFTDKKKKVGVFLSGGIDSSIIAYIALILYPNNQLFFYFLGNEASPDYKNVSIFFDQFNISNDQIVFVAPPTLQDMALLIKKVIRYTASYNPSIISNGIALYLLTKIAKKRVDVVLTGDGADELFCGYFSSYEEHSPELLFNSLWMTELRRLDLVSMANTVELRCPFFDKNLYEFSKSLTAHDLYDDCNNKLILRDAFRDVLPLQIINQKKLPLDRGCGLQDDFIQLCLSHESTEKEYLKSIWQQEFPQFKHFIIEENVPSYFWSYPAFDKYMNIREHKYRDQLVKDVEEEIHRFIKQVPFHNIFILYDLPNILSSEVGGTCSDRTLLFKAKLEEKIPHPCLSIDLHRTYINNKKTHTILKLTIYQTVYFCDVGMGFPITKLIPQDKEIQFTSYGLVYRTKFHHQGIQVYLDEGEGEGDFFFIKTDEQNQEEIQLAIDKRWEQKEQLPFNNKFRFFFIHNDKFYRIKDDNYHPSKNSVIISSD